VLPAFAAHVSAHPLPWQHTDVIEWEKFTDYGNTLRVKQSSAGGWTASRNAGGWAVSGDDCELGDSNGPVTFPTARQAQRAADLHQHDGYPGSGRPGDNLSWLGYKGLPEEVRYFAEDRLGLRVAEAVDAYSRAQTERLSGGMQSETQQSISGLIVWLHEDWETARVGSFDSDRGIFDPYYLNNCDIEGNQQGSDSRMSFDEAAHHYGRIALRERLGPDVSDAAIHDMISDVLARILARSPTSGRVSELITRAAERGELARETFAALFPD
jgi:hypothetical protein